MQPEPTRFQETKGTFRRSIHRSKIVKLVGPVACKLELGSRLKGVHDVFHVSLLKQYEAGGDGVTPPEPIVIDGDAEFEVERILGHR